MIQHYQEEDVLPYMLGMWQDALQSICGLKSEVFNGRHQSCPSCGGKDRFRWTNKKGNVTGEGWAYCNSCGADKGIGWLMRLTGENYSECIDILGRYLGKVPQEYVIKQNKRASRDPGYNFGAKAEHEKCEAVFSRTQERVRTSLGMFEGLANDSYQVGVKTSEDGSEVVTHVIPCHLVCEDGVDDEMVNLLFINDETGEESFYARNMTFGSVTRTGQTEKSIFLVTDWVSAQHVFTATGQETWNCFSPENLEIVAHRYKGERELRVACLPTDTNTLAMAEERDLKVIIPNPGGYRTGMVKKLYKASDLLDGKQI